LFYKKYYKENLEQITNSYEKELLQFWKDMEKTKKSKYIQKYKTMLEKIKEREKKIEKDSDLDLLLNDL